jgi:NADH dehydrogenase
MVPPRKILIIGGGFAGLECAKRLANDARFDVILLDRTNHHLFQPLLYQVATASLAAPDIARSIRQILAAAKNVTVLMDKIVAIDPSKQTASGSSGTVYSYDNLLLATGSQTSYFGHDEWAAHTLGLKTLEDAQNIRRCVLSNLERAELTTDPTTRKRLMTVAIIGGGPTGVELAGAFASLARLSLKSNFRRIDTSDLQVVLIEGSREILETYNPDQSEYARRRLEKLGVKVLTNTRVVDVRKGAIEFLDGTILEAEAILWAAGVAANPLTTTLGISTDRCGRISPNPDLSVPGHPEIFVAGDLVSMNDIDGKPVPGVAPAAVQMGIHVAEILRHGNGRSRPDFRYRDKGMMAIIGKNYAIAKTGNIHFQGYFAWLAWLLIHIVYLIGFRNKLSVLIGWAYAYLVNNPTARIIVHPPDDTTQPPASA